MSAAPTPLARPLERVPRAPAQRVSGHEPAICPCGAATAAIAGLCSRCYRARRRSKDRFGGNREIVLARDEYQCRSCGAGNPRLHVHHRRPGDHQPERLITVCAACHARLHRLAAIRRWIPQALATLWAEQHPLVPMQLQLAFGTER